MSPKPFVLSAAAAALLLGQPAPVQANDLVKGLAAVGIGVAVGCAVTGRCGNNAQAAQPQRQQPQQQVRRVAPADENVRRDQNALNYFGFPAGAADGRMGNQTRSAISNYQAYMGYAPTGQLNDWERSNLQTAHQRAMAGGAGAYQNVVAAEGTRGLLRAFAAEARGESYRTAQPQAPQQPQGSYPPVQQAVHPGPQQTAYPQDVPVANPMPPAAAPAMTAAAPSLPSFGVAPTNRSMADHCRSVELLTQANGGPAQPSTITNPAQALDEQFCGARGYAMSRSQQLAAGLSGVTDAQLREQCAGLVPTLAAQTGALGTADPLAVTEAARGTVSAFGVPTQQVRSIGETCIGVGYQTDDADLVLASAALLVGNGALPYAEVMGHHLRQGFGTDADAAAATGWYETALTALDGSAEPAFLPAQSAQRAAVIRAALSGGAAPALPVTAAGGGLPQLPAFGAARN